MLYGLNQFITLGRKNERKNVDLEGRNRRERDENRLQKKSPTLILFSEMAVFIWGYFLFDKTFISYTAQFMIISVGAAMGMMILHFIWWKEKYRLVYKIFFGIILGGPVFYCFVVATNYYLRDMKSQVVKLEIIETGNRSIRRSECNKPYAVVEYLDIQKDIQFPCEYEQSIDTYNTLSLTMSEGFWGYMVFIDEELDE
jgi:hypothetical protein